MIDGRYRLDRPAGGGLTATVWAAHDEILDRPVRVKLWSDSSGAAVRSHEEELAGLRASDPALSGLLDAGRHGGRPFIVSDPPLAEEALPQGAGHPAVDDPVPTPASGPPVPDARRPDRAVAVTVGIVVLAVVLVGAGLIARPSGQSPDEPPGGSRPIPVAVSTFDPEGDGTENPRDVGLLVDGDPASTWSTDRYSNRRFGNLKPGLGLVLDLEESVEADRLQILTETTGWSAEVHLASAPGETLAEWGAAVATKAAAGRSESFDLGGRTVGAVLIWFTDLGETNRLTVAEVAVMSSP